MALLGFGTAGCVTGAATAADAQTVIKHATVTLVPDICAGVIVGDTSHVLTAAHCVAGGEALTGVTLYDGTVITGHMVVVDEARDMALMKLDRAAPVHPLTVTAELPQAGDPVLFTSRMEHPGEPQWAEIVKLGQCPSLPFVPSALFTSLRGRPGDSGGPVVDLDLHVVGLVHGGAHCSIAAPTADFSTTLAKQVETDRNQPNG